MGNKAQGTTEDGVSSESLPAPQQRPSTRIAAELEAHDGALPPLTKLVSQIPPPPRLPKVDGIKLVAATVHDVRIEPSPALIRRRVREQGVARAPAVEKSEVIQAWGAALAALLAGALVVWTSYAPVRTVTDVRPAIAQVPRTPAPSVAASTDPSSPAQAALALAAEGDALRKRGRYTEAESRYLLALKRDAAQTDALAGLCRTHLLRKDAARASLWANRLVAVAPGDAESHLLLGDAEALLGNTQKARYAWYRARELGSVAANGRLDAKP
ncbi:MAG TPA: hypothetical protein VF331_07040 [Polyangiales bacterium]